MKRVISVILAICLCFSLCACGKSQAVKDTETLIDAIGTVSAGSIQSILDAEAAYQALTPEEQKTLEGLEILSAAKTACAQALIDAISTVSLDSGNAITAAEEFLSMLQPDELSLVTNTAVLETARAEFDALVLLSQLTDQCWIHIHDSDRYQLDYNGKGTHNGFSLTYILEDDQLSIQEGTSLESRILRWDRDAAVPKLIDEATGTYYVRESDYLILAPQVRRENIRILLSWEYWKSSKANAYLSFDNGSSGKLNYPQQNMHQDIVWEMVDNNTAKVFTQLNSQYSGELYLDIVNQNGSFMLLTDDPNLWYEPSGSERNVQYDPNPVEIRSLEGGFGYSLALRADGTVDAIGFNEAGQCNVSSWTDLIAVSGDNMHTLGLRSNGTVVFVGNNDQGQCEVQSWTDIADIDAGYFHSVGLCNDGTVVQAGYQPDPEDAIGNMEEWTDIVAISAGGYHTLGLKKDGTVLVYGYNSNDGRCNVEQWKDIIAVSAGYCHSVGLRSDGTVVAVGNNSAGQCNVSGWTDIVAISTGREFTVGLRADGTVVATGSNAAHQCDVSAWKDIVAISAGGYHILGLRKDGTVAAMGLNKFGQCAVLLW